MSKLKDKYIVGPRRMRGVHDKKKFKFNKTIMKALSKYHFIKCTVWDGLTYDAPTASTEEVDIVGLSEDSCYLDGNGYCWDYAIPVKVKEEATRKPGFYVKSKKELKKWFKENGYIKYLEAGCYDKDNNSLPFLFPMFQFCGKRIRPKYQNPSRYSFAEYAWLPEWLMEVK